MFCNQKFTLNILHRPEIDWIPCLLIHYLVNLELHFLITDYQSHLFLHSTSLSSIDKKSNSISLINNIALRFMQQGSMRINYSKTFQRCIGDPLKITDETFALWLKCDLFLRKIFRGDLNKGTSWPEIGVTLIQ